MKPYLIKPNSSVKLADIDPDDHGKFANSDDGKAQAEALKAAAIDKTRKLQRKLYAEAKQSLLIVLQAMDTGGKDGTIKQVMSGVNPQGCMVISFKAPTAIERSHDFLWRVHREVPAHGMIGIFNRSHYEDILWPRVHDGLDDKAMQRRFEHILEFEELLRETGTTIVKLYLHISKEEQKKRLETRVANPDKRWKFNMADLAERKLWPKYMAVYEQIFRETSTKAAPWYVIPANRKWYRDYVVAQIIADTLAAMKPQFPDPAGIDFDTLRID